MSENLEIEIADGVVRAAIASAFHLDKAKAFLLEILSRARAEQLNKVLIDIRGITGDIPMMARFDFGVFLADQRPRAIKIAFVGTDKQVLSDRFTENVSANRGVQMKVTTDPAEALAWLAE